MNDPEYREAATRIDQLMSAGKLTKGQSLYLATLVQLVQAYENAHHAIDTVGLSGLSMLKQLLDENDMSASDLTRLLGIHVSMGSKILKGERSLTVEHVKKLSARFRVNPSVFLDGVSSTLEDAADLKAPRKSLRAGGRNVPSKRVTTELDCKPAFPELANSLLDEHLG